MTRMIRVAEEDFARLLREKHQAEAHVTELQERGTELVLENRELKRRLRELEEQDGQEEGSVGAPGR
jgi:regulator of replication initiation timing